MVTKNFSLETAEDEQTADDLHTEFLGMVPLNQEVREGGDHGIPVVISNPECNSSVSVFGIASTILETFREN